MAGKTPYSAVKAFTGPIQAALSCFAAGKVTVTSYNPDEPGSLAFNGGNPTKLHGPEKVKVTCGMKYSIVPSGIPEKPWKVHTREYIYRLLTRNGDPIVDFHWHPESTPDHPYPHLHARRYGCKLHYPTGRVLIEDALILAVECGATAQDEAKWARIVKRNRENFAKGATWGTSHPAAQEVPLQP